MSKPVKPRITRGRVHAGGKAAITRHKYVRPGSAEDGDKRLLALKRDLIAMANDGYFDNWPDVKSRVLDDYNPLVELAIAGLIAPGDSQRIIANKIVAEFCFVPLKTEGAAIDDSRQPINITIATWAASAQQKAIEHQPVNAERDLGGSNASPAIHFDRAPAIDVVATDAELRAHRSSPPQPEPTEPAYQEMEMRPDGGGVLRPAPIIEQPKPEGWRPRRYTYNENTARYDVEDD